MKVIFLKNLKGTAKKDEVKNVSDGYAQNFLIPKGFVVPATDTAINHLEQVKTNELQTKVEREAVLHKLLHDIAHTKSVTLTGHPHAKGKLYQAITAQEIVHAIHKEHNLFLAKEFIVDYTKPIKEVGEHKITLGDKKHSISYKVNVT